MKLLYIVNTVHSEDAYRTYAKVHMAGRATPMGKALAIVLGLIMLVGGCAAMFVQGFRILYIFTVLIGLLSLFSQPLGVARMTRQLLKNASDLNMHIDYRFGDEGFTMDCPGTRQEIAYGDLQRMVETRSYFFLYTDVRMAHILPKSDFTQGDPAAFSRFLAEKTGKALQQMDI